MWKENSMREKRDGFSLEATPTIGAVITDLDVSGDIPEAVGRALRQAWLEYPVLAFPRLGDSTEKQLRLSRVFGELSEHPNPSMRLAENPALIALGAAKETKGPPVFVNGELLYGFLYYHQDTYYTPRIAKGAVLRMTQMPSKGGDTSFVDLEKAYAGLSAEQQQLCDERQTIQVYRDVPTPLWGKQDLDMRFATAEEAEHVATPRPDFPPVVQPMAVTQPTTGRRALVLSPAGYDGIYGMDKTEGDAC
jgi:taurine dioxygenase